MTKSFTAVVFILDLLRGINRFCLPTYRKEEK
jgi:hypothetical protein